MFFLILALSIDFVSPYSELLYLENFTFETFLRLLLNNPIKRTDRNLGVSLPLFLVLLRSGYSQIYLSQIRKISQFLAVRLFFVSKNHQIVSY